MEMVNFIPHTREEREAMLQKIGVHSIDELFASIPETLRKSYPVGALSLHGRDELDVQQHLSSMATRNTGATFESFLGGGAYARFIPPVVNTIASRSEFYTAYTPYQPEISQGTLQMTYEFQTMIAELTGMDVANASVYDGATALSEAAFMAVRATRRRILYLSKTTNPHYQKVLQTYAEALGEIELRSFDPAKPIASQIQEGDSKAVAAILVQQPDYFGLIRPLQEYHRFCQDSGSLLVVSADPVAMAVLEPPGNAGADIVCGDIQQFGNPVNYGGPYGGFIAVRERLLRQIPGRIVGRTLDKDGKVAYTLTLQTREQHIRREKATSNICTNQALNILKAAVYMSLVGPGGLRQIAEVSAERAHRLAQGLLELSEVTLRFDGPFLYEFALQLPLPASTVVKHMAQRHGILAGIDLGRYWPEEERTLLIAVTELNDLPSIHRYIDAFKATLGNQGLSIVPGTSNPRSALLSTGTLGREG